MRFVCILLVSFIVLTASQSARSEAVTENIPIHTTFSTTSVTHTEDGSSISPKHKHHLATGGSVRNITSPSSAFVDTSLDEGSGSDSGDTRDTVQNFLEEEFLIRTTETGTSKNSVEQHISSSIPADDGESTSRTGKAQPEDIGRSSESMQKSSLNTDADGSTIPSTTLSPQVEDNMVLEPSSQDATTHSKPSASHQLESSTATSDEDFPEAVTASEGHSQAMSTEGLSKTTIGQISIDVVAATTAQTTMALTPSDDFRIASGSAEFAVPLTVTSGSDEHVVRSSSREGHSLQDLGDSTISHRSSLPVPGTGSAQETDWQYISMTDESKAMATEVNEFPPGVAVLTTPGVVSSSNPVEQEAVFTAVVTDVSSVTGAADVHTPDVSGSSRGESSNSSSQENGGQTTPGNGTPDIYTGSINADFSTADSVNVLSNSSEVNTTSSTEEVLLIKTTSHDSLLTDTTELEIMKNVKSYDKLTELEFFNSVTVVFQKPSGTKDVLYFNQDIFKKVVVCLINVYESAGWPNEISNTTICDFTSRDQKASADQYDFLPLKPNDLVIVYPSPKENDQEEIVSFFVKNSTATVFGVIVSRNRTLTALGQHRQSLSEQMCMEVVDVYGRIPVALLIATTTEEPLHVRHTLLLLILLVVATFCILIIIAGLLCVKCRTQGGRWERSDKLTHDKAQLQGEMLHSEVHGGDHLNSDEDIRKDEALRVWKNGNGYFGTAENGNGSGATVIPITDNDDSWVVPYNQLTADEKAVPETLDTKL